MRLPWPCALTNDSDNPFLSSGGAFRAAALTPPPAPRFIKISESFVPLSRSPSGRRPFGPRPSAAGEGRGEIGVLRRAAKPPAAKPLFNPPSPLAAGQGERGQRGVRGQKDLEIRKCQPILNHPTLSLAKFAKRRYNFVRRLCRRAKFPLTNRSLPRGARESRAERASMGACPRRRPSEPDLGHASGGRGSSLRNTVRPTAGGADFFPKRSR